MERIAHLTQNYSAVLEKNTEITSRLDLKINSSERQNCECDSRVCH